MYVERAASLLLRLYFFLHDVLVVAPSPAVLTQNGTSLSRLQFSDLDLAQPRVAALRELCVLGALLHELDRICQLFVLVLDLDLILSLAFIFEFLDRFLSLGNRTLLLLLLVQLVLEVPCKLPLLILCRLQVSLEFVQHFFDV